MTWFRAWDSLMSLFLLVLVVSRCTFVNMSSLLDNASSASLPSKTSQSLFATQHRQWEEIMSKTDSDICTLLRNENAASKAEP